MRIYIVIVIDQDVLNVPAYPRGWELGADELESFGARLEKFVVEKTT